MALDSYANLKTAIASFADVTASDISAVIDDAISIAERRIWDEVRIPEMEVSLSVTISPGGTDIPARFLDLKYCLYRDSSSKDHPLTIRTGKWIREAYPVGTSTGRPCNIARETNKFIYGPTPDTTYELHGVFYQRGVPVSTSATDNPIFAKRPEIYLFSSLVEIERALKRPDQIPHWESEYQRVKLAIQMDDTQGNDRVVATRF